MVVGLPGPASAASCSGLGEGMRGSESILSFSSVRASNGGRRMKLQSAIEFLTTYGFVLIIIAALISLVFLVVGSARTEIPSACASFGGLDCNFLSFYSNVSSRYSVVTLSLSNSESVPINITNFTVQYRSSSAAGMCTPNFAYPGQIVICMAEFDGVSQEGLNVNGYYSIGARFCNSALSGISAANCTQPVTYRGSFFSEVTGQFSQPFGVTVATIGANTVQFSPYSDISPIFLPSGYTIVQNGDFVTYNPIGRAAYSFGATSYQGTTYLGTNTVGFPQTVDMLNATPSCSAPYNSVFSYAYTTLYVPSGDSAPSVYTTGPMEVYYRKSNAASWASGFGGTAWKSQSAATQYTANTALGAGMYSIAIAWTGDCGQGLQAFNIS